MKIFKIITLTFLFFGLAGCETMHNWMSSDGDTYYPSAETTNTTTNNNSSQNPYSQPTGSTEYYPLPAQVPDSTANTPSTNTTGTSNDTSTKTNNTPNYSEPQPGVINNDMNSNAGSINNNASVKTEPYPDKTLP